MKVKAWNDEKNVFVRAKLFENESSTIIDERGYELVWAIGKTDNKGRDIYEGDIFMGGSKDSQYPRVVKRLKNIFVLLPNKGVFYDYVITGEVIGNIHENPELMEG